MSLYTESVDPQQLELFTSSDYYNEDGRLLDSLFDEASFDDLCRDPLESDWIDSFLKERTQSYVLTDCMMSLSSTTPCVQSEHSYSLATGGTALPEIKLEPDLEFDSDAMDVVNPNLTMSANTLLFDDNDCEQPTEDDMPVEIKQELFVSDEECVTESEPIVISDVDDMKSECVPCVEMTKSPPPTFVVTCTRKLVRQQPTIIVTRPHQLLPYHNSSIVARLSQGSKGTASVVRGIVKEVGSNCTVDTSALRSSPNCHLNYEETRLPPTPPGSNYSDSEASRSPKTSPPSSPHQQSWTPKIQTSSNTLQSAITTAMPTSGILILTDEEKRTLIAEGYPVPTRLPLSKQEEKNLKKVQRKIKNKMSAQESRRKKKDYVESLEKKLEESNQENSQLKQKMENLESDNRSLLSKLQKLQSLASSLMPSSPLQTSTCLMMFALFFAVCLGTWSPASLPWPVSAGHQSLGSGASSSAFVAHVFPATSDYNTPNVRARTLKFFDDPDAAQSESPSIYRNALLGWFSGFCRPQLPKSPAAAVNDEEPYNDTVDENEQTPTDENLVSESTMHEDVDKSVAMETDFEADENFSNSSMQIVNSTWITEDGIPTANPSTVQMEVYAAELVSVTV